MAKAPKPEKESTTDKPAEHAASAGKLPRMRFKHKLILIILSLIMMAFLRTGFVFFVIGMLPAVVAYYMDVSKYRYTFKSVFAANLSGMMPYITKLLAAGPSSTVLQEIMGNATNWGIIYGSALVGLVLVKACPILAQAMVAGMHQTQTARCEWLQRKLENEWGPEVKQFSGDDATQSTNS